MYLCVCVFLKESIHCLYSLKAACVKYNHYNNNNYIIIIYMYLCVCVFLKDSGKILQAVL